jgi:hypothetical protein
LQEIACFYAILCEIAYFLLEKLTFFISYFSSVLTLKSEIDAGHMGMLLASNDKTRKQSKTYGLTVGEQR